MDYPSPRTEPEEAEEQLESEWNDPTQDDMTITTLKQYTYCPRVVYYESCTPDIRPRTYKMEAGGEAHERERERAARRTLFAYHVPEGNRHFDLRMRSAEMGLVGILDEAVITPDQVIVVDYKMSRFVGENHEIQLTAYAMLAEETFSLPVHAGYIYLLNTKRFEKVVIDEAFRNSVRETINRINRIRFEEYMPPPVQQRKKCGACEFRRLCNDV